jgi:hypothetical protein
MVFVFQMPVLASEASRLIVLKNDQENYPKRALAVLSLRHRVHYARLQTATSCVNNRHSD